ncbi:MAG: hypothetical protein JSS36_08910 [Proteobacteria bacterium]|nr:hypothetical protein [Pseudomonadota bacterium]
MVVRAFDRKTLIVAGCCAFWLLLLWVGIERVRRWGWSSDGWVLLAIPAAMLGLTLALPRFGWRPNRLAAATILAILAGWYWLAVFGESV